MNIPNYVFAYKISPKLSGVFLPHQWVNMQVVHNQRYNWQGQIDRNITFKSIVWLVVWSDPSAFNLSMHVSPKNVLTYFSDFFVYHSFFQKIVHGEMLAQLSKKPHNYT